ncbi:ABC transporter ATP-binding protein [Jatrophihabitans fulvus]
MTSNLLRASALTRVFGTGDHTVAAVDGIDLHFQPACLTAIMGPSGSGKSTLLHLLAGLDRPTSGTVTLGSLELSSLSDDDATRVRRDAMGFVFQSFNLFDDLTVEENLAVPFTLGAGMHGPDRAWSARLVDELELGALLRRRPAEISGGQQQRVAIARALVHKPRIVFADEPTGNLDLGTGRAVLGLLAALAPAQGSTVIMVTHDATAAAHADRVVILADGRVRHDLPATDAATLSRLVLSEVVA